MNNNWRKYGKDRHRLPGKWVQATTVEEVWGVKHRKADALAFCRAVEKAERGKLVYGVALAPQPDNQHDKCAIAVLGQCMVKPWFRKPALKEWHIGFVRRELAEELHEEFLSKDIPIASEMYEVFHGGDYVEIKFIVLAPPGHSESVRRKRPSKPLPQSATK